MHREPEVIRQGDSVTLFERFYSSKGDLSELKHKILFKIRCCSVMIMITNGK